MHSPEKICENAQFYPFFRSFVVLLKSRVKKLEYVTNAIPFLLCYTNYILFQRGGL